MVMDDFQCFDFDTFHCLSGTIMKSNGLLLFIPYAAGPGLSQHSFRVENTINSERQSERHGREIEDEVRRNRKTKRGEEGEGEGEIGVASQPEKAVSLYKRSPLSD